MKSFKEFLGEFIVIIAIVVMLAILALGWVYISYYLDLAPDENTPVIVKPWISGVHEHNHEYDSTCVGERE